jgi:hypothetical protein
MSTLTLLLEWHKVHGNNTSINLDDDIFSTTTITECEEESSKTFKPCHKLLSNNILSELKHNLINRQTSEKHIFVSLKPLEPEPTSNLSSKISPTSAIHQVDHAITQH